MNVSSRKLGFEPHIDFSVYTPRTGRFGFSGRRFHKPASLFLLCDGLDQSQKVVDGSVFCLDMNNKSRACDRNLFWKHCCALRKLVIFQAQGCGVKEDLNRARKAERPKGWKRRHTIQVFAPRTRTPSSRSPDSSLRARACTRGNWGKLLLRA